MLILCIDLGTDMIPAISFAYENAELDIMDRQPRKAKLDHLVNAKLISFAYLQIGVIQASAGMYTYFLILNDFGIRPQALWNLALLEGPLPNKNDVYNIDDEFFGNTNTNDKRENWVSLGWDATRSGRIDVRMFYANTHPPLRGDETKNEPEIRNPDDWTECRYDPVDADLPKFYKRSHITDWPICYTTEALKYAQSGYLVSIVCVQWADLMICKTRNLSLAQQGMVNSFGNFGLFSETALVAILLYVPFLNVALGTRQIPFVHFAVPSFSFFCAIFFYDEVRKIWLRSGMVREQGKLKLKGWIVQNTYY